jgi:hypothetical protein
MEFFCRGRGVRPATALPLSYRPPRGPGGIRTRDLSMRSREPDPFRPAAEGGFVAVVGCSRSRGSNPAVPRAARRCERGPDREPTCAGPRRSTPGWSRTSDTRLRRAVLCPLSYERAYDELQRERPGIEPATSRRPTPVPLSIPRAGDRRRAGWSRCDELIVVCLWLSVPLAASSALEPEASAISPLFAHADAHTANNSDSGRSFSLGGALLCGDAVLSGDELLVWERKRAALGPPSLKKRPG